MTLPNGNAAAAGPRSGAEILAKGANLQTENYQSPIENSIRIIEPFVQEGFALHWLHTKSKRPIGNDWSITPVASLDKLKATYQTGNNVGVRLGKWSKVGEFFLHVIDLDIRDREQEEVARARLQELFPFYKTYPTVISGSGGASRHFYILSSQPFPSKKLAHSKDKFQAPDGKWHWAWEIELFGTGKQVAFPPSIHPDTGNSYRWERPWDGDDLDIGFGPIVPADKLGQLTGETLDNLDKHSEENGGHDRAAPLGLSIGEIRDVLDNLQVDYWRDDRNGWLSVGFAIHHETGGGEEGYKLWENFSRDSPKFDTEDQRRVWKSFKTRCNGKPLRMATLMNAAKESRLMSELNELDDLQPREGEFDVLLGPSSSTQAGGLVVLDRFIMRGNTPLPNQHNAILLLLRHRDSILPGLRWNEFSGKTEWQGGVVTDSELTLARVAFERKGLPTVGKEVVADAVEAVAKSHSVHPVRDWLKGLEWAGTPRLDTVLPVFFNVADTPYSRAVGRKFILSMVARIMQPGCKADHVLVLAGGQGLGKSTSCAVLAGDEYFSDSLPPISNKIEAQRHLTGKWLVEFPELAPSRKSESEDLKAFLTTRVDKIRLPYARRDTEIPRQCVFVGTTNESQFLKDGTGGRRFWPVTVTARINIERLRAEREQLFAEAMAAYRAEEKWWLDPGFEVEHAKPMQEASLEQDEWINIISSWLQRSDDLDDDVPARKVVTLEEVMRDALQIQAGNMTMAQQKRTANAMRDLGWEKHRLSHGMVWRKKEV